MISILFLLLLGLLVLGYLLYQQQQKIIDLAETIQELKEIHEIKEIKANLVGRDEERKRIAKDWHDGIGNTLSTLRLLLDTIQPKNQASYAEALSLLEHTQIEFRQIVDNELINGFSDERAIVTCLERWQRQLKLGNIGLDFEVYDLIKYERVASPLKSHLYRIVQELLTNVLKHSKASVVKVVLKEEDCSIKLMISDNGIGLKSKEKGQPRLRSIEDRLTIVKGTFVIKTDEIKGTEIKMTIPF